MLERVKDLLRERYLCDNCLGRQFAQLGSGLTNAERGRAVRLALLLSYEEEPFSIDGRNFAGWRLRKQRLAEVPKKEMGCAVCGGLFEELGELAEKAVQAMGKWEARSFAAGTLPGALQQREEAVWEDGGIEHVEPLRAELNREFGKRVSAALERAGRPLAVDEARPELLVLLDAEKRAVKVQVAPVYVYGGYQKLARGLPQTKWDKYKVTVEDVIAKPFMEAMKGSGHALHGAGREDIDARCLDWRPFVLEIEEPRKRVVELRGLERKVNRSGKVKVRGLRWSSREEVREVKGLKLDKTYRAEVAFGKAVKALGPAKRLAGVITQRTPERVRHRRADLVRKRSVRSLSWRRLGPKRAMLVVRAESGLYVKEFVSGDNGRTKPSVAQALGVTAKVKKLDVIRVHRR